MQGPGVLGGLGDPVREFGHDILLETKPARLTLVASKVILMTETLGTHSPLC